jgi:hypothetical protein
MFQFRLSGNEVENLLLHIVAFFHVEWQGKGPGFLLSPACGHTRVVISSWWPHLIQLSPNSSQIYLPVFACTQYEGILPKGGEGQAVGSREENLTLPVCDLKEMKLWGKLKETPGPLLRWGGS